MAQIFHPDDDSQARDNSLVKDDSREEKKQLQHTAEQQVAQHPRWWFLVSAITVSLIFGLASLGLLWILSRAIAVFIVGITIAAALYPITNWLNKRMPRVLAIVSVYLLLVAILGLVIWLITPIFTGEITALSNNLPKFINKTQSFLQSLGPLGGGSIPSVISSLFSHFSSTFISLPLAIFNSTFDFLVMIFLSIYALIDLPEIRIYIHSYFNRSDEVDVDHLLVRMADSMGGYVRGAVINGFIIGTLTYFGMLIIGVPYALVLGLIAGILELVPVVGPLIAGVPMVIVAFLQSPTTALFALLYVIAMHQFEGHVLVPNIMRSQTEVSQLFIIIAVFAGFSIGGVLGVLAAIPIAAATWVFVDEVVAPPVRKQTGGDVKKEVEKEQEL